MAKNIAWSLRLSYEEDKTTEVFKKARLVMDLFLALTNLIFFAFPLYLLMTTDTEDSSSSDLQSPKIIALYRILLCLFAFSSLFVFISRLFAYSFMCGLCSFFKSDLETTSLLFLDLQGILFTITIETSMNEHRVWLVIGLIILSAVSVVVGQHLKRVIVQIKKSKPYTNGGGDISNLKLDDIEMAQI